MSKYNTFNQLYPYLAVNGAEDSVEHFTNIPMKGQKSIHEELFLYNQFCYLCY